MYTIYQCLNIFSQTIRPSTIHNLRGNAYVTFLPRNKTLQAQKKAMILVYKDLLDNDI